MSYVCISYQFLQQKEQKTKNGPGVFTTHMHPSFSYPSRFPSIPADVLFFS